jgi:GNAT superfamily N-acetyltransferase
MVPVMRNPPTAVRIREAASADWPAVAGLLAELGRPDVRETAEEAKGQQLYERYLGRPDTVALVADDEGRVIGFLDMEFRTWLNFTTPQAWIPDLVVADGARGRGIGSALLARAEEIARSRGCWSMALESATWRERAHAFYVANGWKETGRAFTRLLTEVEWPPAPRT